MLPWFRGLRSDLEILKVGESGTWSDLSVAHRDMVAARLSPSGRANYYGAIPFGFHAAIELEVLGALSDALVCRRRHDKYTVVSEKKLFLTGARADVDSYLKEWRKSAVNRVCEAFERRWQAGSDDDPDPVGDEVRAHGFEKPEEDVDALEEETM